MTTTALHHPAEVSARQPGPSPARSMADAALPTHESHSSISTYAACPLRYAYRYVERRPGEVSPSQFAFGSAVHEAFEKFVRERIRASVEGTARPGREILQRALDRNLAASGLTDDEVVDAQRRAVPVLDRFFAREAGEGAEPVGVEVGFGVPVPVPGGDHVRFVGYVDRVDRAADGSIGIVDYKTGRERSQADVDADRQLTAYAFGCARGGILDPATGEPLPPASRLGLYFAETGELVSTTRSSDQLAAFEADLVATVGHIRAREFGARPTPWNCRWCEYRNECADVV